MEQYIKLSWRYTETLVKEEIIFDNLQNKMEENMKLFDDYLEVKMLEDELHHLEKKLSLKKNASRRKALWNRINEIKAELGWVLMDHRDYEQALKLYQSLPWESFGEVKCNGIARALTEMGFYDEARGLLEVGLRRYPDSYPLWIDMAALYETMGAYFDALECLEKALCCFPEDDFVALYNKSMVLMRIGCYGDAREIIDELMERSPEDPRLINQRGFLALEMGYPHEALEYYQKAMKIWQEDPTLDEGISIYSGLCSVYMDLGMKKEAMEIALEALRRFPNEDPVVYHNLGAVFFEMGWRMEAIEVLKNGIDKFPEDKEMKMLLREIEDDLDDSDSDGKTPLLGALLLMLLLFRRIRKR